jgi:hypothetical protein
LNSHNWVECDECGWIGGNIIEDCTNATKINEERFKKLSDILK